MAEGVQYEVKTFFKAVDKMSGTLAKMGARVTAFGQAVRGTTLQTTALYAKIGAGAAAAAGVGGFGLMVMKGLSFNKVMENSQAQIGTIFQMFGQNAAAAGKVNNVSKQWADNLAMAKGSMNEMYNIAKKSPASFQQVTQLFQNAAAGLATTTTDVGRQMDFVKKAVLAGGLVGGDYQVLGSQVGRILAGSAGAEMNIWKIMQKPVLEAGQNLEIFGKKMAANAKLTEKFNQLTGEQRLSIMEEALGNLSGPVADYFGRTMDGIMSTTMSSIDQVSSSMTTKLYDGFKAFLVRANAAGGIFGPENLVKLEAAANYVGDHLAAGAEQVYNWVERSVIYFSNNWQVIITRMENMWTMGMQVAKMMLTVGAARAVAGTGIMAVGQIISGVGSIGQAAKTAGPFIAKWGKVLLVLSPAIAVVGLALAGLVPILLGVGAYLIENWDKIMTTIKQGFESGRVTLEPLFYAFDTLWAKLVSIGEVLFAGENAGDMMQTGIMLATDAIYFIIDALGFMLVASSHATWGLGMFVTAMGAVISATGSFVSIMNEKMGKRVKSVGELMKTSGEKLADFSGTMMELSKAFENASVGADRFSFRMRAMFNQMQDNAGGSKDYAKQLQIGGKTTEQLRKDVKKAKGAGDYVGIWQAKQKLRWRQAAEKGEKTIGGLVGMLSTREIRKGGEGEKKKAFRPTGNVNIHTLNVHQDLRDTDPDRLLVAFIDPLKEMADKPKTSYFATKQGY